MNFWFALFVLLISGIGVWGTFLYRRQLLANSVLRLKLSRLREYNREQEEVHKKDQAQWELTEEKLRSFLQLMDTLMNTISNPIYFKDADGVFQGCNNVFAKQILGLTRDKIIGKHPQELTEQIPPELEAIYHREERKMIEKEGFHTYEAQVHCFDGRRRDFLFSLAPVPDSQGETGGNVTVLSDLTDKNRAAKNQIQKEKLEGVLETAGAVCHEMNQPLQTLSGYAELVSMTLKESEASANMRRILDQVDRIHDITNKLQRITRYETTDYSDTTKIIDIHKASENT